MYIYPTFPPYFVPTVWHPPVAHCGCAWGCYFGCRCSHCHFQPIQVMTVTPHPVEAKIDRLLVLAEAAEKDRKRRAGLNKKRSHRW